MDTAVDAAVIRARGNWLKSSLMCIVFIIKNPANALAMNTAFGIGSGFAGYILRGKTS